MYSKRCEEVTWKSKSACAKVTNAVAVKKRPVQKRPTQKKAATKKSQVVELPSKTGLDLAFIGSRDEVADTRNVASRERVRAQLTDEVEAFLG